MDAIELYYEGRSRCLAGQYQDAMDLLKQSFDLYPHFKTALLLAKCLQALQLDGASVYIQSAYEMQPNNNEAASEYAHVLIHSGETKMATAILASVLARSPDYGPALKLIKKYRLTHRDF